MPTQSMIESKAPPKKTMATKNNMNVMMVSMLSVSCVVLTFSVSVTSVVPRLTPNVTVVARLSASAIVVPKFCVLVSVVPRLSVGAVHVVPKCEASVSVVPRLSIGALCVVPRLGTVAAVTELLSFNTDVSHFLKSTSVQKSADSYCNKAFFPATNGRNQKRPA